MQLLSKDNDYHAFVKSLQDHFTDGLALVIGSGLSSAEGIPGMPALAAHLSNRASSLTGEDAAFWSQAQAVLDADEGLEAALLKHAPTERMETWIAQQTVELILPKEREVISAVLRGERTLRLTAFLAKVLKPTAGLPILTTNYDRLVEVACEMAGFHVDTTAVGHYAGAFDHVQSSMQSCRGITPRGKTTVLDHFPRAIVLKPHGSFDWYRFGSDARRSSLDLDAERMIITPGLNKYRAGYNFPFDKHRDLANDYLKRASRLLIIGYGFNDDHLQTHLVRRIEEGTPTLILTQSTSKKVVRLAMESPSCICLSKPSASAGFEMVTKGHQFEGDETDWWDLGILANEVLA